MTRTRKLAIIACSMIVLIVVIIVGCGMLYSYGIRVAEEKFTVEVRELRDLELALSAYYSVNNRLPSSAGYYVRPGNSLVFAGFSDSGGIRYYSGKSGRFVYTIERTTSGNIIVIRELDTGVSSAGE